jgi:hypothetical protein
MALIVDTVDSGGHTYAMTQIPLQYDDTPLLVLVFRIWRYQFSKIRALRAA